MNYSEEYAYWYLRLNGFFPLSNFVIHKSGEIQYSSDCDLLAIRPPYVYEEIGGKPDDWDKDLLNYFNPDAFIGIICEVKTARFKQKDLFKDEKVVYSLSRLGLIPYKENYSLIEKFREVAVLELDDDRQVAKLLISNKIIPDDRYISLDLEDAIRFLYARANKYPEEKYRDRMFFSSVLIQSVFDIAALKRVVE